MAKKPAYDNESIQSLKGADRVRKRPGVMFGSDGIEGCQHSFFEILSNSIDEAREGYGNRITVTRYSDCSLEVEDMGRGCPVDFNEAEQRYNWELVFCELYAGGKYNNLMGDHYEYSLGLNGLGACATQYASAYMDVRVRRDGFEYSLHFEKGENIGGLHKEPYGGRQTGTRHRWLPDIAVFTDISIPREYFEDTLKKQAIVNAGVHFVFRWQEPDGSFTEQEFCYENGPVDYLAEIVGDDAITQIQNWTAERRGRDRADKPDYKVKMQVTFAFSARVQMLEYYHNSSFLEHGGSPEKAVRNAFVYAVDAYLKQQGKYVKNESKISFVDVQDCLALITNSFSTQTSYENQTKKAITNKFIQEAMTELLRSNLEIYFIENKAEADKIAEQQALARTRGEGAHQYPQKAVRRHRRYQPCRQVCRLREQKSLGARTVHRRGRQCAGLVQAGPGREVPGHYARARQNSQLPENRLRQNLQKRNYHGPCQGARLRRRGQEQGEQGPGLF